MAEMVLVQYDSFVRFAVEDRRVRVLVALALYVAFALAALVAHTNRARGAVIAAHAAAERAAHNRHDPPCIEPRPSSSVRATISGASDSGSAFDGPIALPIGTTAFRIAEFVRAFVPHLRVRRVAIPVTRSPRAPRAPPFSGRAAATR